MSINSRTNNTKRNIIVGLLRQGISIVLPFFARTAIIYVLGEQYVGLSSLFTSILQVLNLAELGFSTAVVYHMYGPIANGNKEEICALLNLYKRVYFKIGTTILITGSIISVFLPHFIKGSWPEDINIYILYYIYLISTVSSYFLYAYKSALLNAMQRMDVTDKSLLIFQTIQYVMQIVTLLVLRNYYIFVGVSAVTSIASNILTAYFCDKLFPEYQPRGIVSEELRKEINTQIGGVMIGKLSDTSRNSFDSIVLSSLFGLSIVGIYNNYYYVFSSLYAVMLVITHSMQASIGNSIAKESKEKNYRDLRKFHFMFSWISGWCTASLISLYQPFMRIWVGEDMMLSNINMALFGIYFYVICSNCMRNLYFAGAGLWWKGKTSFLLEAISNLILNIVLGKIMGVTGILIATIITILIFNFISRTNILFSQYFNRSAKQFYIDHVFYSITICAVSSINYYVISKVTANGISGLLIKLIICVILPNILFVLTYYRNKNFKDALSFFRGLIPV